MRQRCGAWSSARSRRHRLSGAVRDDGREPHADARRTSAGGARSRWKKLARPAEKYRCWPAAGGYNTAEVIELAKELQHLGVDGLLSVTPYYNKVTQEGLYRHYKAIADAVPLPIVVYNVPGRTGVNVETPTLKRLSEIDNICRREGSVGQHQPDGGDLPQPAGYFRYAVR